MTTINQWLNMLVNEGLSTPSNNQKIKDQLALHEEVSPAPLIVRFVQGVGAWISACFMLTFLVVAKIINFKYMASWGLFGAGFMTLAVILHKTNDARIEKEQSLFLDQLSSVLMLSGKFIMVGGFYQLLYYSFGRSLLIPGVIGLILSIITYRLYPSNIERFISFTVSLFFILIWTMDDGFSTKSLILPLQLILIVLIFSYEKFHRNFRIVGYSLVCVFVSTIWVNNLMIETFRRNLQINQFFLDDIIAVIVIMLILKGALIYKKTLQYKDYGMIIGILMLVAFRIPGLILALGIYVLGSINENRLLMALAWINLTFSLSHFYYLLKIDLATKSYLLICCGLLTLAARYIMVKMDWIEA